jgi:hypothetical protein
MGWLGLQVSPRHAEAGNLNAVGADIAPNRFAACPGNPRSPSAPADAELPSHPNRRYINADPR